MLSLTVAVVDALEGERMDRVYLESPVIPPLASTLMIIKQTREMQIEIKSLLGRWTTGKTVLKELIGEMSDWKGMCGILQRSIMG